MKTTFLSILFFFLIFSCKKEQPNATANWQKISQNVQFRKAGNTLELKSGKFSYRIPQRKLPVKRVVLLNASLVGYFTELGLEDKIVGVSSPEYLFSKKIHQLIAAGKIQNIGNEQKYEVEKIIALKPDLIITNYFPSFENTYELLKKNGIEVVFLDEYAEQNPLEKSKYLLLFGAIFQQEKLAGEKFDAIEKKYSTLKNLAQKATKSPVVITNEIYGGQWFFPGGKTSFAQFIKDAHAHYINADNSETKASPMSFEEVLVKAERATFWVNLGNFKSKNELLQTNPNYAKLNVFNNGKIYTMTGKSAGKANDYFESGVVHADWVLQDYIKIFHPELLPHDSLKYMKELK